MYLTFIFYFLYLSCDSVFGVTSPDESRLIFYYGPSFENFEIYNLTDAVRLLEHPQFIHDTTHLYMHGYRESQDSESIHVIVDAYFKRGTVNILTIDWAKAANEFYIVDSYQNVPMLSSAIADMILSLFNAGLPRESFSIVGHSLGGQLAGQTGREVINKTSGQVKIHRMTALDAAFPLFLNISRSEKSTSVNKNDAEHLQAIHTAGGILGQPKSIGHIDFFPNGGIPIQRGCPTGLMLLFDLSPCSHKRSWRYWAESVEDEDGPKFLGYPSSSYIRFLLDGSKNLENDPVEMGFNCPIGSTGDYYLKTNREYPFAMGTDTVE